MIRRAASIQESVATDHPDYAATLNLLGLQLWFEGQLTAAKDASARRWPSPPARFGPIIRRPPERCGIWLA